MQKIVWALILGLIFLFWIKSIIFIDPDLGWILRSGQYILENGIPKVDQFSYTMPSYPWISHQWLSEVIFYLLYKAGGLPLLGLFLVLIFLPVPFLLLGKNIFKKYSVLPLVIVFFALSSFWSLRPQIFSWVLFAVIIALTLYENNWKKYRLLTPLIFVIWVNLHGAFALGITTLGLYIGYRFFKRNAQPIDFGVLGLSFFVTLINPYGFRIYSEVFQTVSSPELRLLVSEWAPVIAHFDLSFILLIVVSTALVWKYRSAMTIYELILFSFLLILGVTSVKQLPYLALISIVLMSKALFVFQNQIKKNIFAQPKMNKIYFFVAIFIFCCTILNFYIYMQGLKDYYIDRYPDKAINFLKTHPSSGEIFSYFTWTGYFEWKYPEKKVFVDGRMAVWDWKAPYSTELNNALDTYVKIVYSKTNFEPIFNQFNINTVLYPNIEDSQFLKDLEKNHWKKVYEDNFAVIYKRP